MVTIVQPILEVFQNDSNDICQVDSEEGESGQVLRHGRCFVYCCHAG